MHEPGTQRIRQRFRKSQRLGGIRTIDQLFREGRWLRFPPPDSPPPIRVKYRVVASAEVPGVRLLVAVPKKRFPNAVQRNRLRRQLREVFRLHQAPLASFCHKQGLSLACAWLLVAEKPPRFAVLARAGQAALAELIQVLSREFSVDKPPQHTS